MDMLLFEHPLDELTRLSLRIEFIMRHFNTQIEQQNVIAERTCIEAIVNLAHLLDRPDLKSKYAREFSAQIFQLENVAHQDNVDQTSLNDLINQLRECFHYFSKPGKIGLNLRENFFLNTIRQHLLSPGGEADFELPAYSFWLSSSRQEKLIALQAWYKEFLPVVQGITLLLRLVRSRTRSKILTALAGTHHEPLDGKHSPKLLQIYVARDYLAYPTISAGKYRINIRFNEAGHLISEEQAIRDIQFELTLCF